jgi:hypothetical protein
MPVPSSHGLQQACDASSPTPTVSRPHSTAGARQAKQRLETRHSPRISSHSYCVAYRRSMLAWLLALVAVHGYSISTRARWKERKNG